MAQRRIRVVIVGGGTSGWMTAAALSTLASAAADVHLIESEEIGIVGVGEATLPHIRGFLTRLGIDEAEFMAATDATYKLGITFEGFGAPDSRYFHPFGGFGSALSGVAFHHYWLRSHTAGMALPLGDFSTAAVAAARGRFAPPSNAEDDPVASYGYAYHFDATRFAPFLRRVAEARGAQRSEGRVVSAERCPSSGKVLSVQLADERRVEGDLFIDCSGFRALLIGAVDEAEWQSWSHWLPCDRAIAVPCPHATATVEPGTRAIAMPAGWRWRIPLRHRIGNGYVFASGYCSEEQAATALIAGIEGPPLAEPRVLRFEAGRRTRSWVHNVVAIGLASGFLEPLESTSLYLVQMAITQLIERFPDGEPSDLDRAAFNASVDAEYDRIRDFLILHYHATTRSDSPFWNHVRTMSVPDSMAERMALWRTTAQIPRHQVGLFQEPSWVAVLIGQGVVPTGWDPRADHPDARALSRALVSFRREVEQRVAAMPTHAGVLMRPQRAA